MCVGSGGGGDGGLEDGPFTWLRRAKLSVPLICTFVIIIAAPYY